MKGYDELDLPRHTQAPQFRFGVKMVKGTFISLIYIY